MSLKQSVRHTSICKKTVIPPLKKLSAPMSERLITKIQKRHFISSLRLAFPDDFETIPPCNNPKYRHLSRAEAILDIKTSKLVLYDYDEIDNRRERIDELIKAIGYDQEYMVRLDSSAADFLEIIDFQKPRNMNEAYRRMVRLIEPHYGAKICPGCLWKAEYIWRQVDVITSSCGC